MILTEIWILLPASDEKQSLPNLLPSIQRACQSMGQDYRVVVANDSRLYERAVRMYDVGQMRGFH